MEGVRVPLMLYSNIVDDLNNLEYIAPLLGDD
jgi:hypothetical protein